MFKKSRFRVLTICFLMILALMVSDQCGKSATVTYAEEQHSLQQEQQNQQLESQMEQKPIEYREAIVDSMRTMENTVLEDYAEQTDHSLENAYIAKNLYGNAPLTAIVLFETQEPCSVQVCVRGKRPELDIQYELDELTTEHSVGIFGMYADYENHVLITAGEETKEFTILTPPLPENITSIHRDPIDAQEDMLEKQMFLLQDGWYTLIDQNGDIRWYLDRKWHTTAVSGAFAIDQRQNGIWFTYGTTNGSPYRDGAQLLHMDWFGRIDGMYSYDGYCFHHYIDILPNGHLLYPGGHDGGENQFLELNPATGETEVVLDLNKVDWLDKAVGNINPRSEEKLDWAHPNSIEYVEERDCLLISLRNQHMLINLDYKTKTPNWILTPASSKTEDGSVEAWQENAIPYIIVPERDFEWFYSQHDMQYICGDDRSMDFTIFDNGTLRYVGKGQDPSKDDGRRYSRMVRLHVDEKKQTVQTMFEYGKKEGKYLFSRTFGNTQYIPENGHYLGCFVCKNDIYQEVSKIVEVDKNAKPVSCYSVGKIKEGCYRVNAVLYDQLCYETNLNGKGIEIHQYSQSNWEQITLPEESVKFQKLRISDIYRDEDTISLYGRAMIDEDYDVDQVFLVLRAQDGNAYGFPMVLTQKRGGGFYGVGIPLDGLPAGDYRIAVLVHGEDGSDGYLTIRDLITIA